MPPSGDRLWRFRNEPFTLCVRQPHLYGFIARVELLSCPHAPGYRYISTLVYPLGPGGRNSFLVPFQVTSPSIVAVPEALPATYLTPYASVRSGGSALLCSFLGPAYCPNLGRNGWRSTSSHRGAHGHVTAPRETYPVPRRILGTSHATVSNRLSKATVI
jgi:hypothetical protein